MVGRTESRQSASNLRLGGIDTAVSVAKATTATLRIEEQVNLGSASRILLSTTPQDHHIARMAALALGLSVLEAAIPSPLPGVKPGLANIVTLIVFERYGWCAAAWVSLLRVLAGSLLMGNFLAPGFFLSLGGALCSLAVLGASRHLPQRWFGAVSHSIFAAFAHIAGQLLLVYFWLIPHTGLLYLVPVFAAAALLFGTVNGLIAAHYLDEPQVEPVQI